MTNTKVQIYIEHKPEHYDGDISITIKCKPSQQWIAEMLKEMIEGFEGFDFEDHI